MAKKKVRHSTSHKDRAKKVLEAFGWFVGDVEQNLTFPGQPRVTRDLWNVFDLLALHPGDMFSTLGLQVTSEANVASHVMKLLGNRRTIALALRCGWRVEIWGVRDRPVNGSGVKGRTFWLNPDGTIAVVEKSCVLEGA